MEYTQQQYAEELLARRKARTNIYAYIKYMSRTGLLDLKFKPEKHHHVIIDDLHQMVDGLFSKECFSLPPGAAKSTYISVILPTFLMQYDPTLKILCLSAGESLAEDFARRRRAIFRSPEWKVLANTELAPDAQGLASMSTQKGGTVYANGAGSTIQGLRADWLIGDDLVKGFEQAMNITQLDKIWAWYLSEARSRLKPHGKELLVATRWSVLDPIGRVLALNEKGIEDWRYIRIPMECDSEDDPVGRKIGERLWPEWFTEQMVEDAKRDPAFWQCLYQQRPMTSEGEWLPEDHIHLVPSAPNVLRYVIGVDIALSITDKSDWTVFAVFGLDIGNNLTVVEIYRNQKPVDQTSKDLITYCQRYNPVGVYIDSDNASKVWSKLVWEEAKKARTAVPMVIVPTRNKDKETRAAPLRSYFLQDRIRILQAPWNGELLDEMAKFPASRHDDQVDALAVAAGELLKVSAPKAPPKDVNRPQTRIGMVGGQLVLNQSLDELFNDNEKSGHNFEKLRI